MDLKEAAQIECRRCADQAQLDFRFSYAFQPIVNVREGSIFSYEALVRGADNEPAGEIFRKVNQDNLYRFDQRCRVKAIELATRLGIDCRLNINFFPNAVYKPELCIRSTVAVAREQGFPIENIVFEVIEGEVIRDQAHLANIINYYKKQGFSTAIDDFGSGYAGLNLLAEYQRKQRDAEAEAEGIVAQAKQEAEAFAAEAREKLTESLDRRMKMAEDKISQAEAQAIQDVRARAAEVAVTAAASLLATDLSKDKAKGLVDDSIKGLAAKLN